MSSVTVIWSMTVSAYLTLAVIHLSVWCKKRTAWGSLLFVVTAMGAAGLGVAELSALRATTAHQYAEVVRWAHVPSFLAIAGLVGYVRVYLRAGRLWLAWTVCGLRGFSLLLNFVTGVNLNYLEVTRVWQIPFLGDMVTVADTVPNPWMLVGQTSLLLLLVYVVDAATTVWRRGERRQAAFLGGSIFLWILIAIALSVLVHWGFIRAPLPASLFFMAVLLAMAVELGRDLLRAGQLSYELRESEARYRGIFDGAVEGMFRSSAQGNCLVANMALARMLGYETAEEAMRAINDVPGQVWVDPEERARYTRQLDEQGKIHAFEAQFKRKDGSRIWVSLSTRLVRGPDGRVAYFDGFVEEISSRKQADDAMRKVQTRLASAVDLAGLGFYEQYGAEDVVYVDERLRAIFGLPENGELGPAVVRFWMEHIHPDDFAHIMDCRQQLSDGRSSRFWVEYRYRHPDGRELWIHHLFTIAGRDSNGQPTLEIGVVRDITENKRVKHELDQQRLQLAHVARSSTLGQLASSLAHELNQPLGAIMRNAEAGELLLQDPSPDLDEVRAILEDIRKDDERAGAVIDRLRDLMRNRPIVRQPVDTAQLAREVLILIRPDADMRRIRLWLEAEPVRLVVHADRVQLQQVLINLLLNAMDAVDESQRSDRRVVVSVRTADAAVKVSVADTGSGIAVERLACIFEPFYTSKKNGLGMGLPISKSIVEALGGRLWAENNADGGATFTFSLPLAGAGEEAGNASRLPVGVVAPGGQGA